MANLLIAPDCVRYTVNSTYGGRNLANIVDMVVLDQSGGTFTRDDAVHSAAGDVMDAWDQHIIGGLSTSYTALSVSWVDLNAPDGSVGNITSTTDTTWPAAGTVGGNGVPANVAMLATKVTNGRRSSRTGRMYVGGLAEANVDGNLLTSTYLADMVENFGNFTESLTETGIISVYQTFPTVIHTQNVGTPSAPVIEYTGNTQVTNFLPQQLVATQRRRLRG